MMVDISLAFHTCLIYKCYLQRIPKEFIKRFGSQISGEATINVPDGRVWTMGLKNYDDDVWFGEGWPEFAKHYSLGFGSLLWFEYRGNSELHVFICDASGAEIYYPSKADLDNQQQHLEGPSEKFRQDNEIEDEVIDVDNFDLDLLSRGKWKKKRGETQSKRSRSGNPFSRIRSRLHQGGYSYERRSKMLRQENEVAIESEVVDVELDNLNVSHGKTRSRTRRNDNSFSRLQGDYERRRSKRLRQENEAKVELEVVDVDSLNVRASSHKRRDKTRSRRMPNSSSRAIKAAQSENPHFSALIKPFNICYAFVYVPTWFAKEYLRGVVSLHLENSNGKRWKVGCHSPNSRSSALRIGKGWRDFARDNHLQEGDVCVFELIKRKQVVIQVTVYHADDISYQGQGGYQKKRRSKRLRKENEAEEDARDNSYKPQSRRMPNSSSSSSSSRTERLKDTAIKIAQNFKPKNPHFHAVIQPWNMYNAFVYVPAWFAKEYLRGVVSLNLENGNGKRWKVACRSPNSNKSSALRIGRGWGDFARDSHLQEGDVCVFQLVKRKQVILQVTIFRVAEGLRK
ncbi:hypothetical protein L6164_021777 [Bauhinia variegata]|uniref:Uncharacterized protein n=1 Tax=Bauhinia variegata TaxID=167791 RepID=A0ACB9MET4_BAUVA|nr:hypothetical protein L6164_021777 [Bauhinia variegata]